MVVVVHRPVVAVVHWSTGAVVVTRPGRNFFVITFNYDYLAIMKKSIVRFDNVIS